MRYIQLSTENIIELEHIFKTDKRYKSRNRAQALLLSNQGKETKELAEIFKCSQRSIYRWFDRFIEGGVSALHDLAGRRRKPTLTVDQHKSEVEAHIKKTEY
jgi:transposase